MGVDGILEKHRTFVQEHYWKLSNARGATGVVLRTHTKLYETSTFFEETSRFEKNKTTLSVTTIHFIRAVQVVLCRIRSDETIIICCCDKRAIAVIELRKTERVQ